MRKNLIPFIVMLLCMASCASTKKIAYFQDAVRADSAAIALSSPEIRFRPDDKLSIVVSSLDPELTNMFNLPYTTRYIGSQTLSSTATASRSLWFRMTFVRLCSLLPIFCRSVQKTAVLRYGGSLSDERDRADISGGRRCGA